MTDDQRQRIKAATQVLNEELAQLNLQTERLIVAAVTQASATREGYFAPSLRLEISEVLA